MKIVLLLFSLCLLSSSCGGEDDSVVVVDYYITVEGSVIDVDSGAILPDVAVFVGFGADQNGLNFMPVSSTDDDGRYTYVTEGNSPRYLWFKFEKPGYLANVVSGGDASTTDTARTWELDVALQEETVR